MNERQLLVRFGADLSPFEKALIQANKSARQFAGEVEGLGKTLSKSISDPLQDFGKKAVGASEEIDDAMDRIRIGTGATGAELEKLGESFHAVFGEMPESAEQVSVAMTELSRRTGASGQELEALTTQMLELARVSGSEVGPMIQGAEKAFASWGIATKDQSQELDFLWKVSQQTGVGIDELTSTLSGSGSTLRAIGLDFETSAALVGQFQKAGVDSGTVIAGLTKGASAFAKEGKSMADGLRETVAQIKGAVSPSEAAQIAVDKFGKSGIAMADAIRKGALDIDSFLATLRNSPETIHKAAEDTKGYGEAIGTLRRKITEALEPIGAAITNVLVDLANIAGKIVDNVLNPLMQAFGRLPEPVQSAVVVMGGVVAAIGPVLVALGGMIGTLAGLSTAMVGLKATGGAALAGLATLFGTTGAAATTAAVATESAALALGGMAAAAAPAATGIGAVAASFASFALPAAAAVAAIALIVYNWDTLKGAMLKGAQAITTGLSAAWSAVSSATSSAWSGIKSVVSSTVSAALDIARSMGSALVAAAKAAMGPYYDSISNGIGQVASYANQQWESLKAGAASFATSITTAMSNAVASVSASVDRMIAKFAEASAAASRERQAMEQNNQTQIKTALSPGFVAPGYLPRGAYESDAMSAAANPASAVWAPVPGGRAGGAKDIIIGGQTTGGSSSPVREITDFTGSSEQVLRGAGSDGRDVFSNGVGDWSRHSSSDQFVNGAYQPIAAGGSPKLGFSGPRLADGGIVTSPTIAMIGEAGPEAVVPLTGSRGRGMMGGMGGGEVHIHVHVNGSVQTKQDLVRELGRPMRDELNRIQRNGGAS